MFVRVERDDMPRCQVESRQTRPSWWKTVHSLEYTLVHDAWISDSLGYMYMIGKSSATSDMHPKPATVHGVRRGAVTRRSLCSIGLCRVVLLYLTALLSPSVPLCCIPFLYPIAAMA